MSFEKALEELEKDRLDNDYTGEYLNIEGMDEKFKIPFRYSVSNKCGVQKYSPKTEKYETFFPHPIIVSKRIVNKITNWEKVRIEYYDNGVIKSHECDKTTISITKNITSLSAYGIKVTSENARELVKYLAEFMNINTWIIPIINSISFFGWENDTYKNFIPYSCDVVFDGEEIYKELFNGVSCKGDFEKWKYNTHIMLKDDILRAYMASSFGSVLISILKKLPFVVHLWGGSGVGKTVALYVAMSIWGNPEKITTTFNDTVVYTSRKAAIMNNLPLAKNEGETINKKVLSPTEFVYMFCEKQGRGRGKADGGVDKIDTWDSIALTNAEGSLLIDNAKEGELNRVIEFQCSKPLFENAPQVADFVKENYGYAGKVFVKELQKMLKSKQKSTLSEYYNTFCGVYKECGDITEKQILSASIISLADMLMLHFVYGVDLKEAIENTKAFSIRISGQLKTKTQLDISERAYQYIVNWITQNQNKFTFDRPDERGTPKEIEPLTETYGKKVRDEAWIISSVLSNALKDTNFPIEKTRKGLKDNGYLKHSDNKTKSYTVQKRINGQKPYCYVINLQNDYC